MNPTRSRRSKTIYIAGPMRGREGWNHDSFNNRAKKLKESGWNVVNPAELDGTNSEDPHDFNPSTNLDQQDALRTILLRDLTHICEECGAIYMLDGWNDSHGARTEWSLAKALGMKIYYETPMPYHESHTN